MRLEFGEEALRDFLGVRFVAAEPAQALKQVILEQAEILALRIDAELERLVHLLENPPRRLARLHQRAVEIEENGERQHRLKPPQTRASPDRRSAR